MSHQRSTADHSCKIIPLHTSLSVLFGTGHVINVASGTLSIYLIFISLYLHDHPDLSTSGSMMHHTPQKMSIFLLRYIAPQVYYISENPDPSPAPKKYLSSSAVMFNPLRMAALELTQPLHPPRRYIYISCRILFYSCRPWSCIG